MTVLDYLKSLYMPSQSGMSMPPPDASLYADQTQMDPSAQPALPMSAPMPPQPSVFPQTVSPVQMPGAPQNASLSTPAQAPGILDRIKTAFNNPAAPQVLLSIASSLAQSGAASRLPVSTAEAFGKAGGAGLQGYQDYQDRQQMMDARKQAMAGQQWHTLADADWKKAGLTAPAPGYVWQANGNGEVKQVGQDVIKSGTDANGFPTLIDDRKLGSGTGTNKTTALIDSTVDLIGKYQAPLQTALARVPAPLRMNVQQRLMEKYPDYQAENFTMYNKGYRDFGTGQQGNTVRSMNVGISHLNTLGQLADALHNGDVQLLNRAKNYWKTQTGSPAPTNFDAAKNVVAQELVKAITGYPGAASDREAAADEIKNASSPEQLKGVIETYQKLLAGQLMGLKGQYEHSTGRHDFEEAMKLSPDVLQKLDGADTSSADPAIKAMSNTQLLQALGVGPNG